jgi:hypothetical protein
VVSQSKKGYRKRKRKLFQKILLRKVGVIEVMPEPVGVVVIFHVVSGFPWFEGVVGEVLFGVSKDGQV